MSKRHAFLVMEIHMTFSKFLNAVQFKQKRESAPIWTDLACFK